MKRLIPLLAAALLLPLLALADEKAPADDPAVEEPDARDETGSHRTAGEAIDDAKDATNAAIEAAKTAILKAIDYAKENAVSALDTGKKASEDAMDQAHEATRILDKAAEAARDVLDKAKQATSEVLDKAKDAAEEGGTPDKSTDAAPHPREGSVPDTKN